MKNVQKLAMSLVCGVLILPLVAACSTPKAPTDSAKEPVNIAYLGYTGGDFVDALIRGASSVVQPDGGKVELFSANFDPQKQISQCQDAITSGRFKAIILAAVDPATGVPCVRAAHDAGVPVATVETAVGDNPYSLSPQLDGVVAVSGTPLQSQVDADKKLLEEACRGANPCKVIAEIATPTDRWTTDLANEIEKQLASNVKIVQRVVSHYDPGEVAKAVPVALTAQADAHVYLAASDDTGLAAAQAIGQAGKSQQVRVIGLGGSREGAEAVASGTMFGTTATWPIQSGSFLAKALVEAVNGEKISDTSFDLLMHDSPSVITSNTVSEFTAEWGIAH